MPPPSRSKRWSRFPPVWDVWDVLKPKGFSGRVKVTFISQACPFEPNLHFHQKSCWHLVLVGKNGVYHGVPGVPLYGQFAVTCSSWIFDHHFQPFPILPTQIHWYIAKTLAILHRLSSPTMLLSWKPLNPPGILLDHTWLCSFRLCVRDIIPQLSSTIPTIDVCYFSVRLERFHTSNPRIHHLGPLDVQPPWIAQHISQLHMVPYIHI